MTTEDWTPVLVFKDEGGDFFVLPQQTLEQCRVPEERKAAIAQIVAEQDVQGHLGYVAHALLEVGKAVAIGVGIMYAVHGQGETPVTPTITFPPSQEPVRGPDGRPA